MTTRAGIARLKTAAEDAARVGALTVVVDRSDLEGLISRWEDLDYQLARELGLAEALARIGEAMRQ